MDDKSLLDECYASGLDENLSKVDDKEWNKNRIFTTQMESGFDENPSKVDDTELDKGPIFDVCYDNELDFVEFLGIQ